MQCDKRERLFRKLWYLCNMPSRKLEATNSHAVLTFMAEYGRAYLASGGPTSRVEEAVSHLGRLHGYPTEVFATPTGIFVCCVDEQGQNHTTLSRIKESSINLGKLCWLESIFDDVCSRKITMGQANKILNTKIMSRANYPRWAALAAAFLSGFALSFPAFGNFIAALASGLIAMATWWVSGPGLKSRISSSIFRDFFGCVVTLGAAAACQVLMPAPFEAFSIGGLVILVPGLALTSAISELADQNLVSGTAKLMQAVLTLLALGLAYMLFQEMSDAMHIAAAPSAVNRPMSFLVSALGLALSVSCFGVIFNIPRKSLPWATLTGVLSWLILRAFSSTNYFVAASYLASLAVGVISLWCGQRFKIPSQVFSVPGILAMLPGMLALTSMRSFAMGQDSSGLNFAFRVMLTAGSIVFGLFTARMPFVFQASRPAKKTS